MSHSLSPEQKVAVDTLLNQSTSDIKYFDLNTAFKSVFYAILGSINNQKKVLLHIPNESNITKDITELINLFSLDNLTIEIDNKTSIPESDIITLRSVVKKEVDTKPIIENILASEKLKTTLAKTKLYYNALDSKILTNSTFRNFAASIIINKEKNKLSSIIDLTNSNLELDLSLQEFYTLKKEINRASELYQKEFDLFDRLGIVKANVWTHEKNELEELRLVIKALNEEGKEITKKYNETYNSLKENAVSDLNGKISQLLLSIKTHQKECTSYHINEIYRKPIKGNKISLFGKKEQPQSNSTYVSAFDEISEMISKISTDWFEGLPAPQTEDITYDYIHNFFLKNIENAPIYANKIKQLLTNSIHRINRINTKSESVKTLDKRLSDFISRIDNLGIINQDFNANAISFTKQMQMSKYISEVLDQCYNLIGHETPYTIWKTEVRSHNKITNRLISELKKVHQNQWNHQFEMWYNEKIKTTIFSDLSIDQRNIGHIKSINEELAMNKVPALINKLQITRINASEKLKASSKEIYNTLFKKKSLNNTTWNDIALTARPFLQEFFPIHTNSDLNHNSEYDVTISFGRRPSTETVTNSVHYISPILPEDIEEMSESKDLFLYLNDYKYKSTLTELPNTEKLKASKKLAKFILSLNQQVKIYQVRTGNIISLLPPSDDSVFENKMDQFGIKSIETVGALYDKLTESILFTNRQPYLLIKDELINPELHKHLSWQADILQTFKTAGYKILSLNTYKQLIDNDLAFEELISPLITDLNINKKDYTQDSAPIKNNQESNTSIKV
ncbi:MAG: hypothetical protein ACI86M_003679 [Saprospiraceae bacterium]|jgi:hypothetical protein